jgi:hypothetical protein
MGFGRSSIPFSNWSRTLTTRKCSPEAKRIKSPSYFTTRSRRRRSRQRSWRGHPRRESRLRGTQDPLPPARTAEQRKRVRNGNGDHQERNHPQLKSACSIPSRMIGARSDDSSLLGARQEFVETAKAAERGSDTIFVGRWRRCSCRILYKQCTLDDRSVAYKMLCEIQPNVIDK